MHHKHTHASQTHTSQTYASHTNTHTHHTHMHHKHTYASHTHTNTKPPTHTLTDSQTLTHIYIYIHPISRSFFEGKYDCNSKVFRDRPLISSTPWAQSLTSEWRENTSHRELLWLKLFTAASLSAAGKNKWAACVSTFVITCVSTCVSTCASACVLLWVNARFERREWTRSEYRHWPSAVSQSRSQSASQ